MIVDGRAIAADIVSVLQARRAELPPVLRLGILMAGGDKATESFVRIKERVADSLKVVIVREVLPEDATTVQALRALERLAQACAGVVVQLPLPISIDTEAVLAAIPSEKDIDAISPSSVVRAPVAEAVREVLERATAKLPGVLAVVIGNGRLVGAPAAALLRDMGARVEVVTLEAGSLDTLKDADIIVSGAGSPGLIKSEMLKPGVILIDAGTSEQGGKLVGDATEACADIASVFTPVPGGIGPIAVAMLFKNLFLLAQKNG